MTVGAAEGWRAWGPLVSPLAPSDLGVQRREVHLSAITQPRSDGVGAGGGRGGLSTPHPGRPLPPPLR